VTTPASGLSYREAGVDIDAKMHVVDKLKGMFNGAQGTAAGAIGHFGGTWLLPSGPDQILVASADGVGTKLKLAFTLGGEAHAGIGRDIVNHCDNDILALGAKGLFFLDYFATGKLDGDVALKVIGGIADACEGVGLALIGGETAEMPEMYREGEYDLAGFIVGTVPPDRKIDGSTVEIGDVILGFPSNGLHTNGYSLARKVVGLVDDPAKDRETLAQPLRGGKGKTIGEALMATHTSYRRAVQPALDVGMIRGMAHITGGGLRDNVPRFLPDDCIARFDIGSWPIPAIFDLLVEEGQIGIEEQYRVFNMGLGFVTVVRRADRDAALALMPGSRVVGEIIERMTTDESPVQGLSCD
jgi:phosphoribosylformylglycinamidine cyclo-ligase